MIIDASHRRWAMMTGATALGSALLYVAYAWMEPNGPKGGTLMGIIFGAAALAVMTFECLLSLRKRHPASPIGSVKGWLYAHIWLGLLVVVLVACHTGFRWGQGLASLLMWMFTIITVSGIYGVVMQNTIPRRMTRLVRRETLYEQIPAMVERLRREADERVEFVTADLEVDEREPAGTLLAGGTKTYFEEGQRKSAGEKVEERIKKRKAALQVAVEEDDAKGLKERYLAEIRPYLQQEPAAFSRRLFSDQAQLTAYFQRMRVLLPPPSHDVLRDVEAIVNERRELAVQQSLHHHLHLWLLLHAPLSMAFLVLSFVHAVVSLWY